MRIRLAVTGALLAPLALVPFSGDSMALGAPPATATSYGTLWSVDGTANSISAYAPDADGADAPITTVEGPDTGLDAPSGVALSPQGNVYVANKGNNSITEYAATASGDATPIATIAGPETGLDGPQSISFAYGEVWVANPDSNVITSFAAGSTGNELPAETLGGDKTKINHPIAVTVEPYLNDVTVLNAPTTGHASFLTFDSGKRGNTKPNYVSHDGRGQPFEHPSAITQTGGQTFWVTDNVKNSVTPISLDFGGPNFTYFPKQIIKGSDTGLDGPDAVTVDATGRVIVADAGDQTVRVFSADAHHNVAPEQTLTDAGDVAGLQVRAAGPSAPTDLRVKITGNTAAMSWQPPKQTGGGLSNYQVIMKRHPIASYRYNSADLFYPPGLFRGTTHTSATRRQLKPGQRYYFAVAALNLYGERVTREVKAADLAAPTVPRDVHATVSGSHAITVHWQAPANDGGATLRRYTIRYAAGCTPGAEGCATRSLQVNGFQTSQWIGSLKAGTSYRVLMVAHNKAGASPSSTVATVSTKG